MKQSVTLEIEDHFTVYDSEPPRPLFCVTEQRIFPYYNDTNHRCLRKEDLEKWTAETVEELYEIMAKLRVDHTLTGEGYCRDDRQLKVDDFTVEFSNIFVEVEDYDEVRLKATVTYQNLGAARDAQREKEKAEAARQEVRAREWRARQKEEHDRSEFARLSQKYKTTS